MEAKPTLLCIPDISGFTRFMGEIDFDLTAKVVPALLNKVIYSNGIGLKISEIEGDAVLFFKSGSLPTLKDLLAQCKQFYTEFYREMDDLKNKNNGHSGAHRIPELLGLKIILHYGNEVGLVPIGTNIKLMGEDVIVAHLLLKNQVPLDEYILLSEDLLNQYATEGMEDFMDWAKVETGAIQADHLGKVNFHYIDLSSLRPAVI